MTREMLIVERAEIVERMKAYEWELTYDADPDEARLAVIDAEMDTWPMIETL